MAGKTILILTLSLFMFVACNEQGQTEEDLIIKTMLDSPDKEYTATQWCPI